MKRNSIKKERGEKPKRSKYEIKEGKRCKGILGDNSPLPADVQTVYQQINGVQVKMKVAGE